MNASDSLRLCTMDMVARINAGCESRLNKAQEDIRKLEEDREKRDREKNEDIKGAFLYQRKDELRAGKITAETLSAALSDSEGKAHKANETVKSQEKEAEALRIRKEKIASGIEADEILLKETEERLNEILDGILLHHIFLTADFFFLFTSGF